MSDEREAGSPIQELIGRFDEPEVRTRVFPKSAPDVCPSCGGQVRKRRGIAGNPPRFQCVNCNWVQSIGVAAGPDVRRAVLPASVGPYYGGQAAVTPKTQQDIRYRGKR
ncbi:hypothetical protein EBT31_06070 [bacterium]|nr:hypothetical protein [bacterium]